ncbi:radical SAM protein [Clostridium omnivorum]|uniref:Radical SAM protein n=2 Tax=Clostridium omnivorum TaxID=1604902 RepID=A0ABQ5N8X4_9CLOT|nr:radical SAM protein [Clostridium sp. E14]
MCQALRSLGTERLVIMHYKEVKGILSPSNGMNIYRGCTHGCIYCDSRSKCYNMDHAFEDIEVKSNAVELLTEALKRKRKKCMIGTGAMTDPYIHLENQLMHTRKALEVIDKYGFGLSIQTKSNRILRDLDLLKSINEKAKCVVQMTLTTYDENLCRIIEPDVSTTKERFEVLKIMRDNKIPTIVWLDPILPFINDTEENLRGILEYCLEAKVYGILCFNMGLTLREGNREYFYAKLDKYFPGLKEKYHKKYGYSYEILSDNNDALMDIFKRTCRENGIVYKANDIFKYMHAFEEKQEAEQLTLF